MKYIYLLLFVLLSSKFPLWSQEEQSRLFRPNYVSVMPAGFTITNYGPLVLSVGVERKFWKRFGAGFDFSYGYGFANYYRMHNLKLQALYYAVNKPKHEVTLGVALSSLYDFYARDGNPMGLGAEDFENHYWIVGLPIAYKRIFNDRVFIKIMCQPSFASKMIFAEIGHLSIGLKL